MLLIMRIKSEAIFSGFLKINIRRKDEEKLREGERRSK